MKSTYLAILTLTSILITHTFFKKIICFKANRLLVTSKNTEFCAMFGLKQLIEVPTCVTCSSSTIMDHILASFPNRVSHQGVIDVGLSNHQIIYCTRKISRIKRGTHKEIRCCWSKTLLIFMKLWVEYFPNYNNFENINDAYSIFIQKVMGIIDPVAHIKSRWKKQISQEWFDSEVAEKISVCDKSFKKF